MRSRALAVPAAAALALGAAAANAQPAAPGPAPAAPAPAASAPSGSPPGAAPPAYGAAPAYGATPPSYYPPMPYYAYPAAGSVLPLMQVPYQDGDPILPGFAVRSRPHRMLTLVGAVTFGSSYVISALVGATVVASSTSSGPGFAPMFLPVVGPFVTIASGRSEGAGTYWLLLDGFAQASGVAMFAAGWVNKERYLQRLPARRPAALAAPEVLVGPGTTALRWRF